MRYEVFHSFMPECFLDTNLVEVLLNCNNTVSHKKGNSTTLEAMYQPKLADRFIVAVIDEDKVKLKKLEEFSRVDRLCKAGLKLYKHPKRKHFVIQLSPAVERWTLNQCNLAGIDLTIYGLPNDIRELKKMKSVTQRGDQRFKNLLGTC